MSGASDATMANREQFTLNSPARVMNSSAPQPPQLEQQLHMGMGMGMGYAPDNSVGFPYQSIPTTGAGAMGINQTTNSDQKRKRGRPRKYGPDGNIKVAMTPQQPISVGMTQQQHQQPTFSPAAAPVQTEMNLPMDGSSKKSRGRPRGSKNKKQHQEALGSNGMGFVPHVLNVDTGEDVSSKIMTICQNGPRAVCVLSASGTISTATIRQSATSGGTATYEGRFDILSLSGSFMHTEVAGQKSRTGGLSVALAGPDGSVLGGSVAGLLVAASPAQVIVGSFLPDGQREVSTNYAEPSSVPLKVNAGGAAGASSSPSRGTLSESSGGAASPLNLSTGAFNNIPPNMSGMHWK